MPPLSMDGDDEGLPSPSPLKDSRTVRRIHRSYLWMTRRLSFDDIDDSCSDAETSRMTRSVSWEDLSQRKKAVLSRLTSKYETFMAAANRTLHHVRSSPRWDYFADPYILRGYRLCTSKFDVLRGIFKIHNESVNVWSHLAGALIFVFLLLFTLCYGFGLRDGGHAVAPSINVTLPPLQAMASSLVSELDVKSCAFEEYEKTESTQSLFPLFVPSLDAAFDAAKARFSNAAESMRARIADARDMASTAVSEKWIEAYHAAHEEMRAAVITVKENARLMRDRIVAGGSAINSSLSFPERALAGISRELESLRASWAELGFDDGTSEEAIPRWPLYVFFLGAIVMLSLSATYHLFACYDRCYCEATCRADLAGISFMILGSCFPPFYYVFYCEPSNYLAYLIGMTVLCSSTLGFCFLSYETLQRRGVMIARVLGYVSCGALGGVVPVIHIALRWGLWSEEMASFLAHGKMIVMALFYLIGAVFYATRWPECRHPGKYDIFGASHQLWHFCVLAASIVHYSSTLDQYHWRSENMMCGGDIFEILPAGGDNTTSLGP